MTKSKTCSKCRVHKSLDEFVTRKASFDGKTSACKVCIKAGKKKYYNKNREAIIQKEGMRQRNDHPAYLERLKVWRSENKEAVAKNNRDYRERNREQMNEYAREWRKDNAEYVRAFDKSRYKTKLPHKLANNAERRARQLKATPSWFEKDLVKELYTEAAEFREAGVDAHVDHIVPLNSDVVCGLHCLDNLQILDASENLRKNNKFTV